VIKYKSYEDYKETGITWLTMVPKHWEILRTDSVTVYIRNQINPDEIKSEFVFHYSIPAVQETGTGQYDLTEEVGSAKQLITKKSVLISKLNPRKATICIAEPKDEITICSSEFIAMEAKKCDLKYLFYLMNSEMNRQRLDAKVQSVTRSHQRVYPSDIYRFWTALPSTTEQQAIASFLDRETARIDALISKKERMIELLKEKRIALITQAVTKGLDPNVPMKDSGIEWLGEVPEHWDIKRLKYVSSCNDESLPETTDPDYEMLYVDISSVSRIEGITTKEEMSFEDAPSRARRRVRDGDTIVSTVRTYLRAIAPIENAEDNLIVSTGFAVLRPLSIFSGYLSLFLQSHFVVESIVARSVGVSYPAINASDIRDISITIPPLSEQHDIVDRIREATSQIGALQTKNKQSITLLREYRSSLIHHAVTGKIDLRDYDAQVQ
jgi:type I restriction enzyme S subunit